MSSEEGGDGTISSSRIVRRSRSRFGLFPAAAAVRVLAARRGFTTAGEPPAFGRFATLGVARLGLVAAFGVLRTVRFDAFFAALLAVRAPLVEAGFATLFAAFFGPFFALFFTTFFRAFAAFLGAFAAFFEARFAPFALFALFFDAFDLAIGEPLRPWTAAQDARIETVGRTCLDRLS